jgi:hypothetical protein
MVNVTVAPATGAPAPNTAAVTTAVWLREYFGACGAAVNKRRDTTVYEALPEAAYAGLVALIAETPKPYVPSTAVFDDVMSTFADPLAPLGRLRDADEKAAVRDPGTLADRLNCSFEQPPELLFVTDTEYVKGEPGSIQVDCPGVTDMVGFPLTHVCTAVSTRIDAPALSADKTVNEVPVSGSVKLCPTGSAASNHEDVAGVMSSK